MEKWILALLIGTGAAILTGFIVALIFWPDDDEESASTKTYEVESDEGLVTVRTINQIKLTGVSNFSAQTFLRPLSNFHLIAFIVVVVP